MAKVSTKTEIPNLDADWTNDGTGLPYSGKAVQDLIKKELKKRPEEAAVTTLISESMDSAVFADGKVITGITGDNKSLSINYRTKEGSGQDTIDISTSEEGTRKLQVTTALTPSAINLNGSVRFGYGVAIINNDDQEVVQGDEVNARIIIRRQGSSLQVVIPQGRVEATPSAGVIGSQDNIDISSEVQKACNGVAGRVTVVVEATYTYNRTYTDKNTGETVTETKTTTAQGSAVLEVLALTLHKPSINIANAGLSGQVIIPYSGVGNGNKTITLYKNGLPFGTPQESKNYNFSGQFVVQDLPAGITNFQIVAETRSGDTVVRSSSYYFDLFGSTTGTIIALMVEDVSGAIQSTSLYQNPTFAAAKFNNFSFNYYAYSIGQASVPATITTDEIDTDGRVIVSNVSEQVLNRVLNTYSKKIKSSNNLKITFRVGSETRVINVLPSSSSINIELPTDNLQVNLDADGRSNDESNPAVWKYGEVTTDFTGVNWQSNGWVNNSLFLQNGAKAIVNFPLFQSVNNYPVTRNGCAFEILFKCENATLDEHDIISCYWFNRDKKTGLNITTAYVGVNTGDVTEYTGDNDKVSRVDTKVGSQYAQGNWYKYTFVIDPNAPAVAGRKGLCYGYLNGILSYIAPLPEEFVNLNKLPITIDSTYADVYVKSIKYYSAPLTHDQCVDESIIDQDTAEQIEDLYTKNDVLAVRNGKSYISPQKLRAKGRGVMIITGYDTEHGMSTLEWLNRSSDKKSYFGPVRVDYYAPAKDIDLGYDVVPSKGDSYNFIHKNCAIRVQGTTSTKRPRKNYRLHFDVKSVEIGRDNEEIKIKPAASDFIGAKVNTDKFTYKMSPDAVAVPICCLKTDFVDSSMTHNTGGAMVFNEMTRNVASLRNPAQQREYVSSAQDIKTRVAIEGFPIDIFAAERAAEITEDTIKQLDDSNYEGLVYMGQYNFNNDKSKSGKVFGFDGAYTYDEDGNYSADGPYQPVCMEFLDNSADICLFKTKFTQSGDIDETKTFGLENTGTVDDKGNPVIIDNFGKGVEVRAPKDITDQIADNGLDSMTSLPADHKLAPYKYVVPQIKEVFRFIGECAKEVVERAGSTAYALNTMTSADFEELDWTSEKFVNEAAEHFNIASICAWYIWTDYLIAVDQRAKNMMFYTMDGKHWMFQYYDGDTMLGERNDCFLAYDYLTDRDTFDDAAGQYAFQGHDSWLWYLIRANFSVQRMLISADGSATADPLTATNLESVCYAMRNSGKFSAEYFKQIFNGQFVNNWSQRQYNYSQNYKYVQPLTESGYPTDISTNFINTAQGSREAHRTYTLENRFSLLDSKYQAGDYSQDSFVYYANENSINRLKIVSSIPYYFGWKTSNTSIREHQAANRDNDYTVNLTVTGNSTNNPANVLGASRIKELYFDPTSSWTVDLTKDVKLPNLHRLIAKDMGDRASGNLYFTKCSLLNYLDISNTGFRSLNGLEDSSKLVYLNAEDTGIKSVRFAEGAPLETVKLASPQKLFLSNLNTLSFHDRADDTLTAQSWAELDSLLVNKCPNIDWMKLVEKLKASPAETKYLRITGIDMEVTTETDIETGKITIPFLEQFRGYVGLDAYGSIITTGAQLEGTIRLTDYTDDDVVAQYIEDFGNDGLLKIKQPEYTLIATSETEQGEGSTTENSRGSTTNLDNNTGYGTPYSYVVSGHIKNIINRCHRYLGKLQTPGNTIELTGNPADPLEFPGKKLLGVDKNGTMLVIQLADANSTFFAKGYGSSSTRRAATLDGLKGHGEVYVKIPGFWYKGINYTPAISSQSVSYRYTCYSSYEEKPSVSPEIKSFSIAELKKTPIGDGNENGLYAENSTLEYTSINNSVEDRIQPNTEFDIYRVNVEGYKKIKFPASTGTGVCLFAYENGRIVTNTSGSVIGTGEIFVSSDWWLYTGMPVMATVPAGAKYFYFIVKKHITGNVTSDPCDVVMHRGSKFTSGAEMTQANARQWIADMEPDWVYSEPVLIAAAECAGDGLGGLYSPFDGKSRAATGTENKENSIQSKEQWFQYSMSAAAQKRGLQLVDYDATKLIANLFVARYGRRNSQNQLGAGTTTTFRLLGASREYGMTDTVIPDGTAVTEVWSDAAVPVVQGNVKNFIRIGSPVFLGIENVQGNVAEWMDKVFMANETAADCGKVRITDVVRGADGSSVESFRRVYAKTPSGSYPKSVVHGKNCDICSCSSQGGTTTTYYPDYQFIDTTKRGEWGVTNVSQAGRATRAFRRSHDYSNASGGVFYFDSSYSVGYSHTYCGSRLIFRGNIVETEDIDYFNNAEEWRGAE